MGAPATPAEVTFNAFTDENVRADLYFVREGGNTHKIKVRYSNQSGSEVTGINMKVSVKKYLTLSLFKESSASLPAGSQGGVT